MTLTARVEGLQGLDAALKDLVKRTTQKGAVRRTLTKAAEPIEATASALAPDDPATPPVDLHTSIDTGPKSTDRTPIPGMRPGDVIVYVGPTRGGAPQAYLMEFGRINQTAHPFMRPAWEQKKTVALDIVKSELGSEIAKSAARAARKAARAGGR